jgi:ABC-type amino acid transport substrate-binding protein
VAHLVREAFEAEGATVNNQFLPWARALKNAQKGLSVGLYPEYFDKSRETDFVFSDPFPGGPVGLLKRTDDPITFTHSPLSSPDNAFKALQPYTFGVVRGYINTQAFDDANYLKKYETASDSHNLKLLHLGRVDLVFIDKVVANYLIETEFPHLKGKVEMMEPMLEYKQLYIAFSKSHPQYQSALSQFNSGLNKLKQSGRLNELLSLYNIPSQLKPKK